MTSGYSVLIILLIKLIFVKGGLIVKKTNLVDSDEIGSLLDRQIPDDIIYDLSGRKMLITKDEMTDNYLTFLVKEDELGIPYVTNPETGHKYLVKSSRIKKGVDIFRIIKGKHGVPMVADWATTTINKIKMNKYGEVDLVPVKDAEKDYKFGSSNFNLS